MRFGRRLAVLAVVLMFTFALAPHEPVASASDRRTGTGDPSTMTRARALTRALVQAASRALVRGRGRPQRGGASRPLSTSALSDSTSTSPRLVHRQRYIDIARRVLRPLALATALPVLALSAATTTLAAGGDRHRSSPQEQALAADPVQLALIHRAASIAPTPLNQLLLPNVRQFLVSDVGFPREHLDAFRVLRVPPDVFEALGISAGGVGFIPAAFIIRDDSWPKSDGPSVIRLRQTLLGDRSAALVINNAGLAEMNTDHAQGMLVHELAHAAQFLTGSYDDFARMSSGPYLERETEIYAYKSQMRFLARKLGYTFADFLRLQFDFAALERKQGDATDDELISYLNSVALQKRSNKTALTLVLRFQEIWKSEDVNNDIALPPPMRLASNKTKLVVSGTPSGDGLVLRIMLNGDCVEATLIGDGKPRVMVNFQTGAVSNRGNQPLDAAVGYLRQQATRFADREDRRNERYYIELLIDKLSRLMNQASPSTN